MTRTSNGSAVADAVFQYSRRDAWAFAGLTALSLGLGWLAMTNAGVIRFFILTALSALSLWAASVFYSQTTLVIDATWRMGRLDYTTLQGFRPRSASVSFPLEQLSDVWLETLAAGGSGVQRRVVLRVGEEWLPLSKTFSNGEEPARLQYALVSWLRAQGTHVQQGEGDLPAR